MSERNFAKQKESEKRNFCKTYKSVKTLNNLEPQI